MKNILLVVNPCAGKDSKRINSGDIVNAFKKHGIECSEKMTACHGDAIEITKTYASSHDAVICCGGDGTYNEVVTGMMQSDAQKPLIYIPSGSTNDFATTIGVPSLPETAAQMFIDNGINLFDVGSFNEKYFAYIAAFGVGTSFSYATSQKFKNKLGHAAYIIDGFILNIVSVIKNLKAYHMRIEHDDGIIEDDFYFGAVGNTCKIAGMFNLKQFGIKMNDGQFEVILIKKSNPMTMVKIFLSALRQDFSNENIIVFKTSKLKITSPEAVDWTVDGEYAGAVDNVDIKNEHNAISLVSPDSEILV